MAQVETTAGAPKAIDPEVEEALKAALGHREAYAARESQSTRNPHSARKGRPLAELMKLPHAERVLVQWRTAFGCPIADDAKTQFSIECLGQTFILADVRLWIEMHPQKARKELHTSTVHLEFFFDGQLAEIAEDPKVFEKGFEDMIEFQLQEKRRREFRKKLADRQQSAGARKRAADPQASVEDAEGGGSSSSCIEDDSDWRAYLKKPVPPTELNYRATREAGCMIRFLVCQTSLSVSAAEELGQAAFQEHFPIDGKDQDIVPSTLPLPKWVHCLSIFSAIFTLVGILILITVFKDAFSWGRGPSLVPP